MFTKIYMNLKNKAVSFVKREEGVTAIEYAIVVAGVAAIVLVVFKNGGVFDEAISGVFTRLASSLESLLPGTATSA